MPAKDVYHDVVVRALRKDGWTIITEQYTITVDEKRVWIDIRANREDTHRIIMVLEMKSVLNSSAPAQAFRTTGNYSYCNGMINGKGLREDLFLAVPKSAYDSIFEQRVGQVLIQKRK